jgi:hypothetical protein
MLDEFDGVVLPLCMDPAMQCSQRASRSATVLALTGNRCCCTVMRKAFLFGLILSVLVTAAFALPKLEPSGIYCLIANDLSPTDPIGTEGDHPSVINVNVDGFRVRERWSDVQPADETTYNWAEIDDALALAQLVGKKISISVNAGKNCPQWLYDAGAVGYRIQGDPGTTVTVPGPNDPVYVAKWTAFIAAFGARYDGNANLSYVAMSGFGQTCEWYYARTTKDATLLEGLNGGNGVADWSSQAKTFITAFNNAFPTTPFFGTLAKPFPDQAGLQAEKDLVSWATAMYSRFGVLNSTLNAQSQVTFYPNQAVNTYHTTHPAGFQMLWSYLERNKPPGTRLGGTLEQALTNGVNFGGKFVEVYEMDVDDPNEQTVLATKRLELKANTVSALQ